MSTSTRSQQGFALAMPVIHATLVTLLLFVFTWPAATAEPRDVPLGVVGPAPATDQISSMLEPREVSTGLPQAMLSATGIPYPSYSLKNTLAIDP